MLDAGDRAPDFTLVADDGSRVSLSDYLGQRVVLYFYPNDDTPGCTAQACDLRDNMGHFNGLDVAVLGVSPNTLESHQKFKAKYDLNFPLLVDDQSAVAKAYGVWKEKRMSGRTYMGIERSTFIIGSDGRLLEVWRKIRPLEHVARLKGSLQSL